MEKKFIVKSVLKDAVLKKSQCGGQDVYAFGYIHSILNDYPDIKFFETKEDAESYILKHSITESTVVEIFI